MEFTDVVSGRRMVRAFAPEPLPADAVRRLLRNATRAPSAGNSQGYAFLALEAADERAAFWQALAPARPVVSSVTTAPLIVVPLSSKDAYLDRYAKPDKGWPDRDETRWQVPYWHVDTGMAALLMLLTAVDEGLGGLFFGIPGPVLDDFRAAFGVPAEYAPVGALALGYPDPDARPSRPSQPRRPWQELVHHGRWGGQPDLS
ncbi:MAG: nitroreductase family protein [Streptosporangiales bacterium]|nr:nitroreductase family protein [Streptosporangiales bacterium]